MKTGCIYRATKGHYGKPIPFTKSNIKFVDEESGKKVKPPVKIRCEHPRHQMNVADMRCWVYPIKKCFVQKWEMTKRELNNAIKDCDMASLEMKARIICPACRDKEVEKNKQ